MGRGLDEEILEGGSDGILSSRVLLWIGKGILGRHWAESWTDRGWNLGLTWAESWTDRGWNLGRWLSRLLAPMGVLTRTETPRDADVRASVDT